MKRKTSKKNRWADHYTRQAKKENYPARSVFKLREIQNKTRLIGKGNKVLDLGCAPGSWLLYAAELVGPSGEVVGIDLNPLDVTLPANARAFTGDMLEMDEDLRAAVGSGFDVVMSDMAPATAGHKDVDAARSFNLSEAALNLALEVLKPGGAFVSKIFQGPDFESFFKMVRARFSKQKNFKPQSSRKASREIFVIGIGKKD